MNAPRVQSPVRRPADRPLPRPTAPSPPRGRPAAAKSCVRCASVVLCAARSSSSPRSSRGSAASSLSPPCHHPRTHFELNLNGSFAAINKHNRLVKMMILVGTQRLPTIKTPADPCRARTTNDNNQRTDHQPLVGGIKQKDPAQTSAAEEGGSDRDRIKELASGKRGVL